MNRSRASSPSEQRVRLAGPFATADIDRLLTALNPLDSLRNAAVVVVDLRDLGRISAPAVAVLVAALLDVDARGLLAPGSTILAPRDASVVERLQEFDVLELLVDEPPRAQVALLRDRGSRPCQRFSGIDDPGPVAQSLTDAMAEVCRSDEPARHAMWFALNEIAQNVIDHANSAGGGVGIAEATVNGAELEVAIADHGVGIRASLGRNSSYRNLVSDLAALQTAIRAGVSARSGTPGGFGLFMTEQLLRDNGGALIVRSGTAQLEVGATPSLAFDLAPMRGTLVTLRFRTDQPFSLDVIMPRLQEHQRHGA